MHGLVSLVHATAQRRRTLSALFDVSAFRLGLWSLVTDVPIHWPP